ncbi:MAG: hypothetical protein P4M00_01325 [Azospirillaceae bacterium]|nr:hypothetical protein [Azospirillaceae bacterium]
MDRPTRDRVIGPYVAPEGYYEATRAMPFLGAVTCSARTIIAGSWQEIVLDYQVGASGLADGAWIKATFKFYSDWALFQTSDPGAANYVSAEYQAGPLLPGQEPATVQGLLCRFDQKGHERPFQKAIIVDVVDGYLNPGDHIIIRLGDRRAGGPGTRVQTFVEQDFRFRLYIDPVGTSRFAAVPGDVVIQVVPGPAETLVLTAPRLIRPGTALPVHLRTEDGWGNTTVNDGRAVIITARRDGVEVARREVTLATAGWAIAALDDLPTDLAGELILAADVAVSGGEAAPIRPATAYVTIDPASPVARVFYGDLHVHSDDTVGTNDTRYNLGYGRDVAGLDVLGYTANDFQITEERWTRTVTQIDAIDQPGHFVCYPGTEWCGNSAAGGDHNVVFLHGKTPDFPRAKDGQMVRSFEWHEHMGTGATLTPGAWPLDEVYAAYAHDPEGHLMIPHVGGRRCNLAWHHPELERLVEIGSAWGQFPWLLQDAVQRGYRLGVTANSDEHRGRCGGGVPGTAVFGTKGGLTGILADTLDRPTIAKALRARHTFATTGERLVGLLWHGPYRQGDAFDHAGLLELDYRVLGAAGFEAVEAYDHSGCFWSRDLLAEAGLSSRRLRLRWGGARIRDRYRAAVWSGRITITGATIRGFTARNFEHREEQVWRHSPTTLDFRSETFGDLDSLEIELDQLDGCHIEVSGEIGGYVKVGDPRHPAPFIHGPTFRTAIDGTALRAGRHHLDLGGTGLELSLERLSDRALPRDVAGRFTVTADNGPHGLRQVYLVGRQVDGSKVYTSPIAVRFV